MQQDLEIFQQSLRRKEMLVVLEALLHHNILAVEEEALVLLVVLHLDLSVVMVALELQLQFLAQQHSMLEAVVVALTLVEVMEQVV